MTRTEPTNGHRKIFTLAPAQDEMTAVILQTRREVLTDADLSDGAKVLFCILLDWSLWPGKNKGPGVVTISTTKLRELMCRSKRAIYGWKKELIEKGKIWITEWLIPNAWPLHTYHITAIHPQEHGGEMVTQDGLWGNGCRRHQPERGIGARGSTQRKLKLPVADNATEKKADFADSEEISPGNGTKEHLSVANSAIGNRSKCDGEPQSLRLGTAKSATGNRTKGHLPTARNDTSPSQGPALLIEGESPKKETNGIRLEGTKAVPPLPLPKFEPLDTKLYPRERAKIGAQAMDYCTERINALETARQPAPNQKEIIVAYRVRRREVKAWMAGESK